MYASYSWVQVWVYQEDSNGNYDNCYTMHRCVTETQGFIGIYYIIAFSVIFSPVILIFLVIHGVIAKFIWLRRKPYIPPTDNSASKNNNNCDNSISSPSLNMTKRTQLTTVSAESNSENNKIKVTPTPAIKYVNQRNYRSVHRERNVRTFRRIVLMMLAFFALRSPNWISMVFFTNRTLHGEGYWITKYVFSLLNVLCCTLNPLMYCFSDETLLVLRKICGWMRCPTCASWFRERRKRLNTSTVVERKATCDKDTGPVIVHVPRMVPRGPYSDSEKQTVKEPAPVLQTNIQTKEICPTEDNLCNNHDISESSSQINIKVQE
ncbi:uncharacterized protein [Anabrus simplex]|uniref:uncharacterized protein n=1 Tax=Anabrus simplex TaxID=316456 RepID=UPI0035A29B7B